MALSFTHNFRRNNPLSSHSINSDVVTKIITIAFMLFLIVTIPLVNKAQDVLVGLTSNGGPEGEGTAFSIKNNGSNYSIIKSFADWGKNPIGDLVKGNDGNYYGMTPNGGAYDDGTIFMMTPAGNVTVLKQFNYTPDGANPMGELTKDADGNFWGLTSGGGANTYGTIFKITPAGIFTVIRHLNYTSDGANPRGHLVLAKDGNFYGLTYHGGANGVGTIFQITPSGDFTRLRSLTLATDGGNSQSSLTEGKDGDLYGITNSGGANSAGTIFKIKKDGSTFTTLHSFNPTPDGADAEGDLIQASDGNFYGMCAKGGSGGVGTIFKMKPDGSYSVLHPLIWTTDGSNPYGNLLENSDGNLYGLCSGGGAGGAKGVFFKITTGGTFTPLHGFNAATEGITPKGSLIKGADGDLYAMASDGGSNFYGTAFKITTEGFCTTLANFNGATEGRAPLENLIKGSDSAYYGMTSSGGKFLYGTIFKICGGKTTVLHSFDRGPDGGTPKGSLVLASNGSFYGMTSEGGTNGSGTIFKMTASGNYSVLRNLNSTTDGGAPQASLIQGLDGNLYGMTTNGGKNNSGTIFRITPGGDFKVLHDFLFASDGSAPEGGLIQDTDSTFYGMTTNSARIFKITPSGAFNVIRTMASTTDGNAPTGSFIKGTDGNFYATASAGGSNGFGTIFRISAGGNFKVLKSLNGTTDGKTPKGNLLQGSDGNFYGMTSAGGANNAGTIFKIMPAGSYNVLKSFDLVADGGTPFGGLIIAPVNNLIANAQNITTTEDTKKVITLGGSGGSPLTYNILTNPKRGKLTGTGASRTYVPKADYSGTDQFTFSVSVGCISSAPVTVKITITAVNDTPVLAPIGNKTVVKNSLLTFTAAATDVDAGQTLSYSLIGAPAGAAINAATGVFKWTPSATGDFTFKVRVTDNGSPTLFDEEQITVKVTASFAIVAETSVDDLQQNAIKLTVYPSPVNDKLTVTANATTSDAVIRIVDMNGVVVKSINNPAGKTRAEINVAELKPGVYVLQLQDERSKQAVKFVKE